MAMTQAQFDAEYQKWLATNPAVQQEQASGTGDNETYQPGGMQNYVDYNGRRINLGQPGQSAQGTFQVGAPDDYGQSNGTTQFSSPYASYDPNSGFSQAPDWRQNYHGNSNIDHLIQNAAILGTAGVAGYGALGAVGAGGTAAGATSAGEAASLAAAENGILGSTVGMGTGATAGGGAALTGASQLANSASAPPAQTPPASSGGLLNSAANALNSPAGGALLSAGLGAAAGATSPRTNTTTSSQTLPAYLQPYADQYAAQVAGLAQKPYTPYEGQGVAGFNSDQQAAFAQVRQQTGQSNPLNAQAQQGLSNTMSGQYLDPATNPYLRSTFDQAAKRATDAYDRSSAGTNAAFRDAGSFGSAGHQSLVESNNRAFGDSLASLGNSIYGGNYQQERGRQENANLQAPNAAGAIQANDFRRTDALASIGQQQQQNAQQGLDFNYGQFQRRQDYPYKQADTFAGLFNTNLGRNSTTSTPGVSTSAGLLGGAAAGLGLYRNYSGLLGSSTQNQPQVMPQSQSQQDWLRYGQNAYGT